MKNILIFLFVLSIGNLSVAQSPIDTLLLSAVKSNNFDSVQLLVEQGADVNFRDSKQAPIVMWAALKGDLNMVKYLIDNGADVKKKGLIEDSSYGPFIYGNIVGIAASRKEIAMLNYLIEECGIPYDDKEIDRTGKETGWDILGYAIQPYRKDTMIANYFIRKDTLLDPIELFSLSIYLNCNYDSLILKRINSQKNIEEKLWQIRNLLEKAIINNHVDLTNKLLGFDPDLNILSSDSLSLLALSIVLNKPDIITLLLESGANPDQECKSQKNVLFFAIDINNIKLIDELIQYGANIDHQDCMGRTPLFYSILQNRKNIAKHLIEVGADPTFSTIDNDNVFRLTRDREDNEILSMLNKKWENDRIPTRTFHPKLLLPTSQSGTYWISTSPDDKYISGSNGGVFCIWNSQTGRMIQKIKPKEISPFCPVQFYTDRSLIYASPDASIILLDIEREEITKEIPLPSCQGLTILPNTKWTVNKLEYRDSIIAIMSDGIQEDGFIQRYGSNKFELIDVNTNKKIHVFNDSFSGTSNNGNYITTMSYTEDSITIWRSGKFDDIYKKIKIEPFHRYHTAEITNNGEWILMECSIWDTLTNSQAPGKIVLHNLNTSQQWSYKLNNNKRSFLRFAPSDSIYGLLINDSLKIYKISINNIPTLVYSSDNVSSFCFANNTDMLFIASTNGSIKSVGTTNYKARTIVKSLLKTPIAYFSDSLNNLRISCRTNKHYTINLNTGVLIQSQTGKTPKEISAINFNLTGDYGIARNGWGKDTEIFLLDFQSNPISTILLIDSIEINGYKFNKNNEIFIGSSDNQGYTSEMAIYNLRGEKTNEFQIFNKCRIGDFALTNDLQLLSIARRSEWAYFDTIVNYSIFYSNGGFNTYNVDGFDTIFTKKTDTHIISLSYTPDGEHLLVAIDNGTILVFERGKSKIFKEIEIPGYRKFENYSGYTRRMTIRFLESNSNSNVYATTGKNLIIIDCDSLEIIVNQPFEEYKSSISRNSNWLFSPSTGGSTCVWDIKSNKEICRLYLIDSMNFIVQASSGLFDATPGAMDKLYYVAGMETIDLEQLKHRYYQPGLLPILLGYSNEKLREVPSFDYVRLFPKKELKIENGELTIDLTNQGGGIGKVSVFIDNIEIIKDARPKGDADSSNYEMTIPLDLDTYARYYRYDTTNVIKVVAWNAEGYLSSRPDTIHYIPSSKTAKGVEVVPSAKSFSKPHLYGLVVGTSDYAGSLIDLQYAAKDATAFYEALNLGANRLFGEENVSLSLLTTEIPGQEPTLDNIFMQLMEMRKARPDDIVVVYFSGHGVNYGGQDGEFYYLTMTADGADAAYLNDPMVRKYRTISSQDLAFELNQIPARKKVLILDACSSGQAANNLLASLKDIPSSQKRALEFTQDATGSHILASSAPNSVSYETKIYAQGLLTYALLKGMRGGRLKKIEEGEFIDVEQLLQYAKAEVPSLAKSVSGIQEPIYRTAQGTSFIIGQMTEEDKEKIKLAEPLPVFIPCKFTNQDLEQADIDLEKMLDSRLDQLSAKGTDADIQFIQNTNYPDAYQITGNYSRKGKKVEVTYILKKGNLKFGGLQKESGDPNNLFQLAEEIIKNVKETISDN